MLAKPFRLCSKQKVQLKIFSKELEQKFIREIKFLLLLFQRHLALADDSRDRQCRYSRSENSCRRPARRLARCCSTAGHNPRFHPRISRPRSRRPRNSNYRKVTIVLCLGEGQRKNRNISRKAREVRQASLCALACLARDNNSNLFAFLNHATICADAASKHRL